MALSPSERDALRQGVEQYALRIMAEGARVLSVRLAEGSVLGIVRYDPTSIMAAEVDAGLAAEQPSIVTGAATVRYGAQSSQVMQVIGAGKSAAPVEDEEAGSTEGFPMATVVGVAAGCAIAAFIAAVIVRRQRHSRAAITKAGGPAPSAIGGYGQSISPGLYGAQRLPSATDFSEAAVMEAGAGAVWGKTSPAAFGGTTAETELLTLRVARASAAHGFGFSLGLSAPGEWVVIEAPAHGSGHGLQVGDAVHAINGSALAGRDVEEVVNMLVSATSLTLLVARPAVVAGEECVTAIMNVLVRRTSVHHSFGFGIGTKTNDVKIISTVVAANGLAPNDVIIAVNGQDVRDLAHAEVLALVLASTALQLMLVRGAAGLTPLGSPSAPTASLRSTPSPPIGTALGTELRRSASFARYDGAAALPVPGCDFTDSGESDEELTEAAPSVLIERIESSV